MGEDQRLRVVIVGGGTAGWMTAAALTKLLPTRCDVHLVESEAIGIVGVGEATLPHIRAFNERLGINEAEFMAATRATFKLGIEFQNWGKIGDSYIHPFGTFGRGTGEVEFHHYWARQFRDGPAPGAMGDYSMAVTMAYLNRFMLPDPDPAKLESTFSYAYQFDATLFGPFLREQATGKLGVERIEGKVVEVRQDPASGDIAALVLESGSVIEGDLFVDCSGFRSLLLGGALGEAWEDWSPWLPCDRAAALPCAHATQDFAPLTSAIAMPAGWRWRIPLQHRMGNGYVFSSQFISEDEACAAISKAVEGEPMADPRVLRFRAGRRAKSWNRNVIAVGLSSGFLEPLESTSLYLSQMAITYLIELFPIGGLIDPRDRDEFNRLVDMEYDRVRDFLILHFHATTRDDSEFWNHVRTMQVPDTLSEKMALWRETGRVEKYSDGLFYDASWIAVYIGQGIVPEGYDMRAGLPSSRALADAMTALRSEIRRRAEAMPDHRAHIERYCPMAEAA